MNIFQSNKKMTESKFEQGRIDMNTKNRLKQNCNASKTGTEQDRTGQNRHDYKRLIEIEL